MSGKKWVSDVVSVNKKYTVQSTGIWEFIRRRLSVDPNRSNGVPLNPMYRNPPPGANPPQSYDDPVTLPAADIAENPYWKRDTRRAYPRLSVVDQAQVAGLLTVGSKAKPLKELVGEAGAKELVSVTKAGQERGLSPVFEADKELVNRVLGEGGLPPMPVKVGGDQVKKWEIDETQGYPEEYPCRTFV